MVDRLALETKLNLLLHQEQAFWKQRAKVFWLTDGDLNTKFFHISASNRKNKNLLRGLFDETGKWCTSDDDLEGIALRYYGNLFTTSMPTNILEMVDFLPSIISEDMNVLLTKDFSEEEIHSALMQMHPSKAPGLNGFSPRFYQHFWPLIGKGGRRQ